MGYLARATRLLEEYRTRHGRMADPPERDGEDGRQQWAENLRQFPLRGVVPDQPAPPLVDAREVAWRVEVMRRQLPATGPLPFLVARHVARGARLCASCGDLVAAHRQGLAVRCNACILAAQQVTDEFTAHIIGGVSPRPIGRDE